MLKKIQREGRVAFSPRVQPHWLRVVKWIVFLSLAAALYPTRFFRHWTFGLPLLGLAAHLFYRWQTRGWTRPWGGWDDLAAGR